MESRWSDQGARNAIRRWGVPFGENFALRLYTAHLIGTDPMLVLHGGGNVSVKGPARNLLGEELDAIYVKGSGWNLATLDAAGLPGLELARLRRLRSLDTLTDEEMVNEFLRATITGSSPTPSMETLVHAFLPHRFVDHSHADAVLVVTNHADGEAMVRDALGDRVAVVPYVRPGFDLAKVVLTRVEAEPNVEGIVLLHHGLITFGQDARTAYERHVSLVDACERFATARSRGLEPQRHRNADPRGLKPAAQGKEEAAERATRAAPILRGVLAWPTGDEDRPHRRSVLEWRCSAEIIEIVNSTEAAALASTGPLTGDHVIHTKAKPLLVEKPSWSNEDVLTRQLREAVEAYRQDYTAYVTAHGGPTDDVDPSPRVVLLPGAGLFCWARTKQQARITADIAEQTLFAKARAAALGAYTSVSDEHLCDMEFRSLQRAKLGAAPDRPLEGQVVVISGGAGAIGSSVAVCCAEAGAHVVITDLDKDRVARVVARIERQCPSGTALGLVMNVTDPASVREGFDRAVRAYGGVDVVVPNAGIAHVATIEEMDVADFRRVMEVNAVGYLLFMQEGIRVMKRQSLGGNIVINASKNVFGPGKDFGAYSASKAAGHQLGKVAAIELAGYGIRVNMINADAVFGDEESPSGLWATVGPQRAQTRGLRAEELPEYYRGRNLLKARVYGHHIGRAVVFFASNATPTTGATLPIDGGIVDAFPR